VVGPPELRSAAEVAAARLTTSIRTAASESE